MPDDLVLVTVSGRDRPGLATALLGALAPLAVGILDVEQVEVRGRLLLGILVEPGEDEPAMREGLDRVALDLALSVDYERLSGPAPPRRPGLPSRHHVTVLAEELSAEALSGVAAAVARAGANIDRIVQLSRYPVTSYELQVSRGDAVLLRRELAEEAVNRRVDVAVERAGLHRRAKRLIVLDVDSTLVQGEVIEALAARAGCGEEVAAITRAAMAGQLDFEAALRTRVALLAGLDACVLREVGQELQLTPGARTLVRTLARLGYVTAIVSGGFTEIIDDLKVRLGIDHAAANHLEVVDGRLTGRLQGPVIDRPGKAQALERFAVTAGVPLAQTVAVGDGANDVDMITRAGLGIAFNAKPVVRAAADTALSVPYLDAILFLLGINREEVEEADAEDATAGPPPTRR